MNKIGLLLIISTVSTLVGCGDDHSENPRAYFDKRPELAELQKPLPGLSPAEREAILKQEAVSLKLRQTVFDFMASAKMMKLVKVKFSLPSYSSEEKLEHFVKLRCGGFVEKMANSAPSTDNMYSALQASAPDLKSRICNGPDLESSLTIIPGKVIKRFSSENHIGVPYQVHHLSIALRPDNSVSGFRVADDMFNELHTTIAFVEDGAVVTSETFQGTHRIVLSANTSQQTIKIQALDQSFMYKENDNSSNKTRNTQKRLTMRLNGGGSLTANERLHVEYRTDPLNKRIQAHCEIEMTEDGQTYRTTLDSQCFPEHRN